MKWALLGIFVFSVLHIHFRGKVRLPFRRQIFDHSSFMAPLNLFMHTFSKVPATPYLAVSDFPELAPLQQNWHIIRDEALRLQELKKIKAAEKNDDVGFNSFFKYGWKRFYLKWYGANLKSAEQLCPKTLQLLNQLPSVKGAMFTMLPPGSRLGKHRDPYAGSLRYHLGLVTPNSDDCYISVDGQNYSWRDGEAVMFDETYIHHAENKTDQNRIILFLDVKRPVNFFLVDFINEIFSRVVVAASATKNIKGDKVGALNHVFSVVHKIGQLGKKLKAFNQPLYRTLQYGLYIGLIYWIFF